MYLIILIIIIVIGVLFLRHEGLTLEELNKQLESSEPTLLPQYTKLQYEKMIKDSEIEAKPILETLAKSDEFKLIRQKKIDNLKKFEERFGPRFNDPRYIRLQKAAFAPPTLDEGISIEGPYILENIRTQLKAIGFDGSKLSEKELKEIAKSFNINTSSRLQKIKDSVADIRKILREDDKLRKKMEKQYKLEEAERRRSSEENSRQLRKKQLKREPVASRLRRKRREKTAARRKAQAELKAKAQAELKAKAQAVVNAKAQAVVNTKAKAQAELKADVQSETQKKEETKMDKEEIMKINNVRNEAEEVMNQLREIPLEERIRKKVFVQPKVKHVPYAFVKSTPANPPYDTTKYNKRENLFKTSEISSIFPQVKLSNTLGI